MFEITKVRNLQQKEGVGSPVFEIGLLKFIFNIAEVRKLNNFPGFDLSGGLGGLNPPASFFDPLLLAFDRPPGGSVPTPPLLTIAIIFNFDHYKPDDYETFLTLVTS